MNIKLINHIGNAILILIFAVGVMQLYWSCIFVGALLLSIVRVLYIKAEEKQSIKDSENTQTAIEQQVHSTLPQPPNTLPSIRLTATYITACLMSGVIYGIGFAIGSLLGINVQLFS